MTAAPPSQPVPSQPVPAWAVVSFGGAQPELVAAGGTTSALFRQLFLEPYELRGERLHPGPDWTVYGVLVATDRATVVAVPLRRRPGGAGTAGFVCQASDDGTAPAVSAVAGSAGELLDRLREMLTGRR